MLVDPPDEAIAVVIDGENLVVTFEGSCSMCGGCCLVMCTNNCMTDNGVCRYLAPVADGKRLCLIQKAVEENDTTYLSTVSDECMAYWNRHCKLFPASLSDDYDPLRSTLALLSKGWPFAGCGFTMEIA